MLYYWALPDKVGNGDQYAMHIQQILATTVPVSTVFGPVNAPAGYFNSSHMEDNTVGELRERIEDVRVLKSYVRYRFDVSPTIRELIHTLRQAEELQKSIDDCRFLVDTQATADLTGYRELRDWAKTMLQAYEYLTTVLISISTVGASLVYATIFRWEHIN
ncbi:hypothetical protein CVT25_010124 [Psilocybe cyanescens]|uniref:Uncharacterized protein n=1 Tax=Psilocybe cyanescens TaxID=93625 RepID=A0A409XD79_PSICY|nr:hypothetical protein CVT25_010124 [Psilocybe cyanescens]